MSVIITGLLIRNLGKTSVAITEADGPQTFSQEYEARLVSEGIAKYVGYIAPTTESIARGVATAVDDANGQEASVNIPEELSGSKGEETAQKIPEYNTDMKAAELREIMEGCKIPYKVGMSKADMVSALDAYFEDEAEDDAPPDLGAEDPIV